MVGSGEEIRTEKVLGPDCKAFDSHIEKLEIFPEENGKMI